jgi:hypothetical protein
MVVTGYAGARVLKERAEKQGGVNVGTQAAPLRHRATDFTASC